MKTTGLLLHFDEERRSYLIQESIEGGYGEFSDALSVTDWPLGQLNIALLSFSELTIDYICLAKKDKRVVTSKNRINFSGLVNLHSIPIQELEARINNQLKRYFIKASQGTGGIIPLATWHSLINAIKEVRPSLAGEIDRLLSLQRFSGYHLYGDSADILLQEREALGIALDIFSGNNQLRNRVLSEWAPQDDTVYEVNDEHETATLANLQPGRSSFMKGISQRYLLEEAAIQHDLFNWQGMTPLHESGVSIFEQGGRKLEIHYANRNALEHTLGVDLIYYSEAYGLFVLIQYKLMRDEAGTVSYRPDNQLSIELARMDSVNTLFKSSGQIQSHEEFRLNEDGFFLKLVPSTGLKPASGELIKGMYVTREYMNFLIGPNGPKGSQGGSNITFSNSPRYLTNSQFSESVNAGWIGTRGVKSEALATVLRQFYESGRAILLAYESSTRRSISSN